jgi:uncharacterized BrkB/YihY/UPF0761 family membrane protein
MTLLPGLFLGGIGLMSVLSGGWLLIAGRNFPGVLGRGFTQSDEIRIRRAPPRYWRVAGAISLASGVLAFAALTIFATNPTPSRSAVVLLSALVAVYFLVFTPLVAWFIALSAKHRLFRWDNP